MMIKKLLGSVKEEDRKTIGSIRNCNTEGKVISKVERKLRNESRRRLKVNMSGFIAFNADYHVPKPHPPKNN